MTTKDNTINLNVACDTGAIGFIKDLAKAAGEDLVYSLALEKGNVFMCVTAFPSMTRKKFDTDTSDGMRAIFLIDESEYGMGQTAMVDKLAALISKHTYYEDDVDPLPATAGEALQYLADKMDETGVTTDSDNKTSTDEPTPGHGS